jgi:hypothetical protein
MPTVMPFFSKASSGAMPERRRKLDEQLWQMHEHRRAGFLRLGGEMSARSRLEGETAALAGSAAESIDDLARADPLSEIFREHDRGIADHHRVAKVWVPTHCSSPHMAPSSSRAVS